jgi:hypothetical protein
MRQFRQKILTQALEKTPKKNQALNKLKDYFGKYLSCKKTKIPYYQSGLFS